MPKSKQADTRPSTELIEHGKITRILLVQVTYTPPTGKFVAAVTVLTSDGRQHTFTGNVDTHPYRDQISDLVRATLSLDVYDLH